MSNTQKAIWAFWIIILGLAGWQFYTYNVGLDKKAQEQARETNNGHYFFYHGSAKPLKPQDVVHTGTAFIMQTGFKVERGVPNSSFFTYNVTIKNTGTVKATAIQVRVRPYKGIIIGDPEMSLTDPKPLDDSDPASQIDQWVSFPDLDPGQSATKGASFLNKSGYDPGKNPNPDVHFQTAKQ